MPFIARANAFLEDAGDLAKNKRLPIMQETVRYMLKNAVGIDNAKSTEKIVEHLQEKGLPMINTRDWQINILGPLRENGIFIGSKRAKGMFLIKDENDAKVAISQIQSRIDKQNYRLSILKDMCRKAGFKIDQM